MGCTLVQDNAKTDWIRLLNLTKDEMKTYQNSRFAMLDPLDMVELTLHLKQIDEIETVEVFDCENR